MTTLAALDSVTRLGWLAGRAAGVAFIFRCFRLERQAFYMWLLASWLLSVAYPIARLVTDVEPVLAVASFTTSIASSVCGVIGFARLSSYLRRRIVTIRRDHEGHFIVRPFADEDDRPTLRPTAR